MDFKNLKFKQVNGHYLESNFIHEYWEIGKLKENNGIICFHTEGKANLATEYLTPIGIVSTNELISWHENEKYWFSSIEELQIYWNKFIL